MDWMSAPRDEELWKSGWEKMKPTTAMAPYDVELMRIDDESLEFRLKITDVTRQPFGLFHGGVSMLLAETAASFHSCWGADLSECAPVGIEISGSHLSSARDGHVRVVARIVRRGRTLVVHEVDIIHEETDKLLCRGRCTNLFVAHQR